MDENAVGILISCHVLHPRRFAPISCPDRALIMYEAIPGDEFREQTEPPRCESLVLRHVLWLEMPVSCLVAEVPAHVYASEERVRRLAGILVAM